ncbi:hypothetical protein KR49_11425 [Synechococcus sp. KORDI-49]|uniref:peptide chain release factor N(5)-glutamine methyltransferase n=1 Tax=Synechococcales TaxID=1890424 RepID=UPI0004E06626|nr:peptide chain release factor N(5)-glutamine methyltransferase [Synechococcus sp. KORDI-49]AII47014.1 hypothetical protein KR49_11425 [Synechococcus sp. KORDI-49]
MTDPRSIPGAELMAWRRAQLKRGGRGVDLDWLLDLGGGLSWRDLQLLMVDADRTVILQSPLEILEEHWLRHLQHQVPLQHLVGLCPWRDVVLEVSEAALIPRQETELLLELASSRPLSGAPRRLADLGTGSGAIAVGLGRSWPDVPVHAVEISPDALLLAERNLRTHGACACWTLHCGSWWEPLRPWWGAFDLVLSNPPYIPSNLIHGLEPVVRDHEPHLALSGGADGLDSVRAVVKDAPRALSPGGWLLIEHHHDQSDAVVALMQRVGLSDVDAAPDLQGVMRFAMGRRPL